MSTILLSVLKGFGKKNKEDAITAQNLNNLMTQLKDKREEEKELKQNISSLSNQINTLSNTINIHNFKLDQTDSKMNDIEQRIRESENAILVMRRNSLGNNESYRNTGQDRNISPHKRRDGDKEDGR